MTGKKTILVVDDEMELCNLARVFFEARGVICRTAESCEEAVSMLKVGEGLDYVLCDFRLADGNGLAVLEQCLKLRPHPRFYLMSGYADVTAAEAKSKGAVDIIQKPFSWSEVVDRILDSH